MHHNYCIAFNRQKAKNHPLTLPGVSVGMMRCQELFGIVDSVFHPGITGWQYTPCNSSRSQSIKKLITYYSHILNTVVMLGFTVVLNDIGLWLQITSHGLP